MTLIGAGDGRSAGLDVLNDSGVSPMFDELNALVWDVPGAADGDFVQCIHRRADRLGFRLGHGPWHRLEDAGGSAIDGIGRWRRLEEPTQQRFAEPETLQLEGSGLAFGGDGVGEAQGLELATRSRAARPSTSAMFMCIYSFVVFADRENELMGNLSLHKELDFILTVNAWRKSHGGKFADDYKHVTVRTIKMKKETADELRYSSKFNRSREFMDQLRSEGRAIARGWLDRWPDGVGSYPDDAAYR